MSRESLCAHQRREPFKLDDVELERSHGDDERLSVENVGFALQFMFEVIVELN